MINLSSISFGYQRSELLFSGLDLRLTGGGIYGLLGKNGAGKTTLLKLLTGLLFPKSGECDAFGFEPRVRSPGFLQEIFMISEEFYVPPIYARDFERLYAPFYPRFDSQLLKKYLDEFQIDPGKKLSVLSYGQKKKFLLAFGPAGWNS